MHEMLINMRLYAYRKALLFFSFFAPLTLFAMNIFALRFVSFLIFSIGLTSMILLKNGLHQLIYFFKLIVCVCVLVF